MSLDSSSGQVNIFDRVNACARFPPKHSVHDTIGKIGKNRTRNENKDLWRNGFYIIIVKMEKLMLMEKVKVFPISYTKDLKVHLQERYFLFVYQ